MTPPIASPADDLMLPLRMTSAALSAAAVGEQQRSERGGSQTSTVCFAWRLSYGAGAGMVLR